MRVEGGRWCSSLFKIHFKWVSGLVPVTMASMHLASEHLFAMNFLKLRNVYAVDFMKIEHPFANVLFIKVIVLKKVERRARFCHS